MVEGGQKVGSNVWGGRVYRQGTQDSILGGVAGQYHLPLYVLQLHDKHHLPLHVDQLHAEHNLPLHYVHQLHDEHHLPLHVHQLHDEE